MVQRILVGLDGSTLAESVLPYVAMLAGGLHAEVTLLHVTHVPEEVLTAEYHLHGDMAGRISRAQAAAQDYLQSMSQGMSKLGLPVRTALAAGDAATKIVEYAREQGVDLIALATHGRSGLQRWRSGSVADRVLHLTRVPLLLVRPREGGPLPPPEQGVQEVVVPLDGSDVAEAALPLAEAVATAFGAPVVLVRAVQPLYLFGEPAAGSPDDIVTGLRETVREYLEGPAPALRRKGLTVSALPLIGDPAGEIIAYADSHPGGLIVMATEGRSGLMRMLVGSIAERVAHHAATPVLLVRPQSAGTGTAD